LDILVWLRSLGLERYEALFRDHEIDAEVLPELSDADLAGLGIPLGSRKKLLKAIAALGRDVPSPALAAAAAAVKREAERRQLTVMFCDLVGSTALASQLDPEDLRDVIGAYHRCIADTVGRYDGFVAKYMGDGVLIYFGWPRAHENEAEQAVRAGLAVIEAVAQQRTPQDEVLACRIGIATGQVVVGDLIGEGAAQEQAVVGETPNLAARLQSLAGSNEVVIGPGTRRLVAGLFDLADLGSNELKGFDGTVRAWRVAGQSRAESQFAARSAAGLTPLIDRQHELGMLLDRFEQAKDSEGQVVLLSGEPGVGKSRLAHTLLERLADQPHTRLRYYCSPYHVNSALHPIIEQLERVAGFEPGDRPEQRLDKLEALLGQATNDVAAVASLFAALLSLPVGTRYPPLAIPAQRQRELTLVALLDQLGGLAARQPVLVVLEDSQWLDPTSTELFERVIERVQTLPVLLLITYRPDFAPPWISYPHMTTLTLNRLGRRHSTEMIAAVAGGKPLPAAILDQIWAKTEGVPLFVEELTKTVLEAGLLEDKGDRYVLSGPLPPLAIPTTLQDSLMARLDRFAPVKEVAQIGAVIGREFSYRLLSVLSPLEETALQEALSQLVSSELVFRRGTIPDATYSFKHAFVQDAAYRSLLKSRRQQVHAQVAEALCERFPDVTESQPEVLAHHLTEAGLTVAAIGSWCRAGQLAAERSANAEALAHFYRNLDLLRTLPESTERNVQELDLLIALGSVLIFTKGYSHAEVAAVYGRARDLCRLVGDTFHLAAVLQGLRIYHMYRADLASAQKAAEELLALGEGTGDCDDLVQGQRAIGMVSFFAGAFQAARDHLERGIALYDIRAHDKHALRHVEDPGAVCLFVLGRALWMLGYPDQAVRRSEQAIAVAQATAHAASIAEAMIWRAEIALLRGEVQDARQRTAAALTLVTEYGLPVWSGQAIMMHGWALSEGGHSADGVAQIREGLSVLVRTGEELYRPYYLARLAEALGRTGQVEEGLSALDQGIEISCQFAVPYWDAELQRQKGELFLATDNADRTAAEACFRLATDIAQAQSARSLELRATTSLARLLAEQGKRQQAHDLLAPIYGWFTEGFDTADLKDAKALLDELCR
jgi:predicted ATPase/class 3 adenylate cyclase